MSLSRFNLEHLDNHGNFKSWCPMTDIGASRNESEETDQWLECTDANCVVFVTYKACKHPWLQPGTQQGSSLCSGGGMSEACFPGVGLEGSPRCIVKRRKENKLAQNRAWSPREDRNLLTCLAPTSWLSQQQFLRHSDHEGLQEGRYGVQPSVESENNPLSLWAGKS